MQLTHNMRNSRHIIQFQEGYFGSDAKYTGTPAVLGPLVDLILTIGDDVFTIGLGKLITHTVNNFYTWRQSPYNYIHYMQSIRHGTRNGW